MVTPRSDFSTTCKVLPCIPRRKVQNFTFVDVDGHSPGFKPLDGLVKVPQDFTVGRREGLSANFGVVDKL